MSETRSGQTMTYRYDNAGARTRITWPDASPNTLYAAYSYDMLNRVTQVGENGATSGVGLLASYTYDDHGRRTNIARAGGAGAATVIGYEQMSAPSTAGVDEIGPAAMRRAQGERQAALVLRT